MVGLKRDHRSAFDILEVTFSSPETTANGDSGDALRDDEKKADRSESEEPNDKWLASKIPHTSIMKSAPETEPEVARRKTSKKLEKRATMATIDEARLITNLELSALDRERAVHMSPWNAGNAYCDVTGFDVLQPNFLGMTTDQWRDHKQSIVNSSLDCKSD